MQVFPVSKLWLSLHELRLLPMDESTEGQAIPPGRCEVGDIDSLVPMSLPLTPVQQAARMDLRLYREKQSVSMQHHRKGHLHSHHYFLKAGNVPQTVLTLWHVNKVRVGLNLQNLNDLPGLKQHWEQSTCKDML